MQHIFEDCRKDNNYRHGYLAMSSTTENIAQDRIPVHDEIAVYKLPHSMPSVPTKISSNLEVQLANTYQYLTPHSKSRALPESLRAREGRSYLNEGVVSQGPTSREKINKECAGLGDLRCA